MGKTDLREVVERLASHGRDAYERGHTDRNVNAVDWLDAKGFDMESTGEVMTQFSIDFTDMLYGDEGISILSQRELAMLFMQAIGIGIELGYTTCELQQEQRVFGDD